MTRSRGFLLIVLALIIIGVVVGLTQWYKPHRTVDSEKGIVMSTDSLTALYNADEHLGDSLFLDKPIQVKGTVKEVKKNEDGFPTVLFASSDGSSSVFCTMRDKDVQVNTGQEVVVKGFCSAHVFTDVVLRDCILVK